MSADSQLSAFDRNASHRPAREPFAVDATAPRAEVIVSYERFTARRRLRQRIAAKFARRAHTTPDEEI